MIGRHISVHDRSHFHFQVTQGTLLWQPILGPNQWNWPTPPSIHRTEIPKKIGGHSAHEHVSSNDDSCTSCRNLVSFSLVTIEYMRFNCVQQVITSTVVSLTTFARDCHCSNQCSVLLARDVIYTSHAYATMSVSICLSVCLWQCDRSALAHYS